MNTPNWQHHSNKEKKRKLRPQALRSSKEKRRHLINRLTVKKQRRFSSIMGISKRNTDGSTARNQVTTSKVACY